mmetsp:Transcript_7653/g.12152  ORF Transcript_7653/g.12152 Transcript_7653/m.12152 type:complete len:269 (+) Transcript_7653:198-1004(+)
MSSTEAQKDINSWYLNLQKRQIAVGQGVKNQGGHGVHVSQERQASQESEGTKEARVVESAKASPPQLEDAGVEAQVTKPAAKEPKGDEGVKEPKTKRAKVHLAPIAAPRASDQLESRTQKASRGRGHDVEGSENAQGAEESNEPEARKIKKGRLGMRVFGAERARKELSGWFSDLIKKKVAVGNGVTTKPVHKPPPVHLTRTEKARKEEEELIHSQQQADVTGTYLETATKQAKQGNLVSFMGNELTHKSSDAARQEMDNFYDSLGGR